MRGRRSLVAAAAVVTAIASGWATLAISDDRARTGDTTSADRAVGAAGRPAKPGAAATNPPPGREAGAAPGGSPVADHGRLRVCGVRLCDRAGDPVQLRGMSSHGIQWFPDCVNRRSLTALRDDWRADFIRIAMYVQEGGYETDPAGFTRKVNEAVELATALGLYVIIDFHVLNPGDPTVNLARARSFFADVAAAHADKNNVIYEVANEPNGVSWKKIKRYAERVIPVIRSADPDAVVLVGTRGWSSLGVSEGGNETEVINDPVDAKNVMYTFHFYAASHKDLQRQTVARAARRLPLFVSEFGTQTYTGNGPNDLDSSAAWLSLLTRLRIGYAMWSFSDGRDTNSAFQPGTCQGTEYAGTGVLSESGRFIRSRIRASAGTS
jgi:endoglucanase